MILNKVKKYMDLVEEKAKDGGLVPLRHRSELETHVKWLFQRIALKMPPESIVNMHNKGDGTGEGTIVTKDAVQEGVRKLARLLEVKIPRNRL